FLVLGLSLCELLLNFFCVDLAFLNPPSSFFEHRHDRLEGELAQNPINNEEKNDLGDQVGPIDPKLFSDVHRSKSDFLGAVGKYFRTVSTVIVYFMKATTKP